MGAHSRLVLPLLAGLVTGSAASAQTSDRHPTLEIVLEQRVGSGAAELPTARARARFLFAEAGIRLAFVERDALPSGYGRAGLDRITLVVAGGREADALVKGDVRILGFAIPPASRVYVHYDRVRALARERRVEPGWFLGVVMAHELAHVLLPAGHSDSGVMRKTLNPDPARVPAFSKEEGTRLRDRVGEGMLLALR
jgi:hypothetical protein